MYLEQHNTGEYVGNLNPWAHCYIAELWETFQKMWPWGWS